MILGDIKFGGGVYQVDLDRPIDISIPLRSGDHNPNCYYSDPPLFSPIQSESFQGSVALGGPLNHNLIQVTPHGNGTHTECVGHLSDDPGITINKCLNCFHFLAKLISVAPRKNIHGDMVIFWEDIQDKMFPSPPDAVIIRTLPNNNQKLTMNYNGTNPPYLDVSISEMLAQLGVSHLLVDLPSVDKEEDGGKLEAHHAFWRFPDTPRVNSTISELIYVPDAIPDGDYLLNLQIISLESDASPSKPVLYRILNYSKQILK